MYSSHSHYSIARCALKSLVQDLGKRYGAIEVERLA